MVCFVHYCSSEELWRLDGLDWLIQKQFFLSIKQIVFSVETLMFDVMDE